MHCQSPERQLLRFRKSTIGPIKYWPNCCRLVRGTAERVQPQMILSKLSDGIRQRSVRSCGHAGNHHTQRKWQPCAKSNDVCDRSRLSLRSAISQETIDEPTGVSIGKQIE